MKRLGKLAFQFILLLLLVWASQLPSPVPEPARETPDGFVRVTKVVDGDTFKAVVDGKEETIRLIGLDTPETVDPRKPVQCFGREASARAKELLLDKDVRLTSDPTQGDRDKYGRLLRYAYLPGDGRTVAGQLIAEGYGREYTYDEAYAYQTAFRDAQAEAQAGKHGLWADGACD